MDMRILDCGFRLDRKRRSFIAAQIQRFLDYARNDKTRFMPRTTRNGRRPGNGWTAQFWIADRDFGLTSRAAASLIENHKSQIANQRCIIWFKYGFSGSSSGDTWESFCSWRWKAPFSRCRAKSLFLLPHFSLRRENLTRSAS